MTATHREVIALAKVLSAASGMNYVTGSSVARRAFENQARAAFDAGYMTPTDEPTETSADLTDGDQR
jgi:hypothetical protein